MKYENESQRYDVGESHADVSVSGRLSRATPREVRDEGEAGVSLREYNLAIQEQDGGGKHTHTHTQDVGREVQIIISEILTNTIIK